MLNRDKPLTIDIYMHIVLVPHILNLQVKKFLLFSEIPTVSGEKVVFPSNCRLTAKLRLIHKAQVRERQTSAKQCCCDTLKEPQTLSLISASHVRSL